MWPKSLIEELAARRCIIFMGSGASAGCQTLDDIPKSPPTWKELLEGLKDLATDKDSLNVVNQLIEKENYLDAAEVILSSIPAADFSGYIRDILASPNYKPSSFHKSIFSIDPKIVITTNYDEIYDNYCKSGQGAVLYNVCKYYESHLVSDLKSPARQVIKAHGCISNPSKIVLTRSQFFIERQKYPNFYKVLDALFLTNTLFFVGYSISDPDIQLLLENSNIAYEDSHPHYAFIAEGMSGPIKEAYKRTYNIEFIEFPKGDYDEANKMLNDLQLAVNDRRESNPTV